MGPAARELYRQVRLRWPRGPRPLEAKTLDGWLRRSFGRRARAGAIAELVSAGVLREVDGGFRPDPRAMTFGRPSLPYETRLKVIERDGLRCGLCRGRVRPDEVEIHHVIPVALGGTDELGNLQVAHRLCNRRKGLTL